MRIRQLLDGVERLALFVIADELFFRNFLQLLVRIAPNVPQCNAPLFSEVTQLLREITPPLFRQWWNRDANDLSVVGWIQPQVRLANGLLDLTNHRGIPRLNRNHCRFRHVELRNLIQWNGGAIIINPYAVE